MAVAIAPLNSLQASGSVGDITFNPIRGDGQYEARKVRAGSEFVAEYPARVITGRATVRIKNQNRPELRKKFVMGGGVTTVRRRSLQSFFRVGNAIANWLALNNIGVYLPSPSIPNPIVRPWWDRIYFARYDNIELRKFPGQARGQTVAFRRGGFLSRTQNNFIMHQLCARNFERATQSQGAIRNLPPQDLDPWINVGTPPQDLVTLVQAEGFNLREASQYINLWVVGAFLQSLFIQPSGWTIIGSQYRWTTDTQVRPANDPAVIAWQNFFSGENNARQTQVEPWS